MPSGRDAIDRLRDAEAALGLTFNSKNLLEQAFVHRSFLNENPGFPFGSNERLEFLGDAVLGFVVTTHLYIEFPSMPEGGLTSLRAALVRSRVLARVAATLALGEHMYLGRGEEASGGRSRPILLARTFEAVVGAIFLDQGIDVARALVLRVLQPELERAVQEHPGKDYKSRLQEVAQSAAAVTPSYSTVAAVGPDHAKEFTVQVLLGARVLGEGRGRSKREAEQAAARAALDNWAAGRTEAG